MFNTISNWLRRSRPSASGGTEHRTRVLVIEDDSTVRQFISYVLEENGCSVTQASDGVEAAVRNPHDFDLIVTDVNMPRMSGTDAVARLRERRPELPVLFVTGRIEDFCGDNADRSDPVLGKPFTATDLLDQVAALLNRARA